MSSFSTIAMIGQGPPNFGMAQNDDLKRANDAPIVL